MATGMRRRSKRWQRDSTVTGTLRISVVAKTNLTCGGGSSRVFSNALKALRDSMWTSSTMNTLVRACMGRKRVASIISRTSSTPVREAASISTTSGVTVGEDAAAVGADAARVRRGAAGAVRPHAVQRARDDSGGGGLAHAAHAGEHEGVGDAVQREGVAQDSDHRVLADQVVEGGRAILAGQHAVGRGLGLCGGRRRGQAGRSRLAEQAGAFGHRRRQQVLVQIVRHQRRQAPLRQRGLVLGGRPTNDPCVDPLRLLPSGPDRVGRAPVRRRPPGGNISLGGHTRKGQGKAGGSAPRPRHALACFASRGQSAQTPGIAQRFSETGRTRRVLTLVGTSLKTFKKTGAKDDCP